MSAPFFPTAPAKSAQTAASTAGDNALCDALGRSLRDLRISVTDRCNLRCTYCMPRELFQGNHRFLPRSEVLDFEEIVRVAGIFKGLGVRKIRITGGEPLLRRDIDRLIGQLSDLGDLELAMTTNGLLLPKWAKALKAAGLHRLTVSLDALDETVFQTMADAPYTAAQVLDGIAAAEDAGFTGLKVNAVIKRGVNDREILPLAERFRGTGVTLRFIEFMDVGETNGWRLDQVLPSRDVLARIETRYPLEPLAADRPGEVASRWRYLDGAGEVGVISSVTQPFCQGCTRLRLSAEGKLYRCLFAENGLDLRPLLRGEAPAPQLNLRRRAQGLPMAKDVASDEALRAAISDCWQGRDDRYSLLRSAATKAGNSGNSGDSETGNAPGRRIEMSYIGG